MSKNQYKFAPPGQMIDLGGYSLHAQVLGSGGPAVVFEAGMAAPGLQWSAIQPEIARQTTTVSYDRAGMGWSDEASKPRTPAQVALELHQILHKLSVAPPYILVSHSFGGLISRFFAKQYPDQVQGLVLVDTSHERQLDMIKNQDRRNKSMMNALNVMSYLSRVGPIGRVIAGQTWKEVREHIPAATWEKLIHLGSKPRYHRALRAEMMQFGHYFGPANIMPADHGDLPLIVVTAAESMLHGAPQGGFSPEQLNQAHLENQAALVRMSTRGEQVIVPGATHISITINPSHAKYVTRAIEKLLKPA